MMSDAKNRETDALERNARGNILLGLIENENAIANDEKQPQQIRDAARANAARYSTQLDDILNSGGSMAAGMGAGTPGWLANNGTTQGNKIKSLQELPSSFMQEANEIIERPNWTTRRVSNFITRLKLSGYELDPDFEERLMRAAVGGSEAKYKTVNDGFESNWGNGLWNAGR